MKQCNLHTSNSLSKTRFYMIKLIMRGSQMKTGQKPSHIISIYLSVSLSLCVYVYIWLYSPCRPWPFFHFLNLYAVGRTPWTGDQPVAGPLPTHRTTQTQNKSIQTASSGIRTHDSSIRAGEDSSCLTPRGHCDQLSWNIA
jgi:hypothetical protein